MPLRVSTGENHGPSQSHEVVNVSQVRTVEVGYRTTLKNKRLEEALMLTNDENIVDIQFAVQYKLKDASDWVFNNRDQEDMVRQVAETAIREVVGGKKMDFVLYEGRDQIASEAQKLMQQIFDQYHAGVLVTSVTMQGVSLRKRFRLPLTMPSRPGRIVSVSKMKGRPMPTKSFHVRKALLRA